jgi:hypothetical protein
MIARSLRPGAVLIVLLAGCAVHSPHVGRFSGGEIREASGLVKSRRHAGVFWTHNDSGDRPRIFAVDDKGRLLAEYAVKGAEAIDWEDIAIDDLGRLYIADTGNNDNERRDLTVYRIPEPDPSRPGGVVSVEQVIRFHYPEQIAFPDRSRMNFDAEALFWVPRRDGDGGRLYLLTKHRSDRSTVLYRFDSLDGEADLALTRLSSFEIGAGGPRSAGMVTAADATPDGGLLAVLTYGAVVFFERPPRGDDYLSRPAGRIELVPSVLRQCEAIAWDAMDLLIANEQGRIFRIPDALAWTGRFPHAGEASGDSSADSPPPARAHARTSLSISL